LGFRRENFTSILGGPHGVSKFTEAAGLSQLAMGEKKFKAGNIASILMF
jgi:hypothetical protein